MSFALSRKYRPSVFSDVAGQVHIVETLTNALRHDRVAQSYLFTGPRGTGKTTLARLLAKAVNCENRDGAEPCGTCPHCLAFSEGRSLDVIEIDAASHTGVDNIRELRETVALPPTIGTKKVYIIDEAHMLSTGAWNALLKTLEEPPEHVVFILATTELHKIPDTILSRSQRFDFARLPLETITGKLAAIAQSEKVDVDPEAIRMIATAAEGGMRDAESLLTQVISLEDEHVTAEEVSHILGITEETTIHDFARSLANQDLSAALAVLRTLSNKGFDFRIFSDSSIAFFRSLVFTKLEMENTPNSNRLLKEAAVSELADRFSFPDLARLLDLLHNARKEIRHASVPELPLEIAALTFLYPNGSASIGTPGTPASVAPPISTHSPTNTSNHSSASSENPHAQTSASKYHLESRTASAEAKASTSSSTEGTPSEKAVKQRPVIPFERIAELWSNFLDEIRRTNASLALAFSSSLPRNAEGGTVDVVLRHKIHKDKLERPENRLTAENTLATILGTPMTLRFVLEEAKTPENDPLVNDALSLLGGKVVS